MTGFLNNYFSFILYLNKYSDLYIRLTIILMITHTIVKTPFNIIFPSLSGFSNGGVCMC